VLTSYKTSDVGPSRACAAQALASLPRNPVGGVATQAPVEGAIRRRVDTDLGQHPQAVELAGRLDDPRQHQLPERLIPADSPVEPERVVGATQPLPQRTHPRGGNLQRPPRRTRRQDSQPTRADRGSQAEIQLALPTGQPLPRRGLERFQLCIVVGRPDVLDRARPAPRAVHDLHRPRSGRRPHGAHVGHDPTGYEIDLVRQFGRSQQ
jgi:hypothetical protein